MGLTICRRLVPALACSLGFVGCQASPNMDMQQAARSKAIPYSVKLPPDLPKGCWCYSKYDIPSYITTRQIRSEYLSDHLRGWCDCLCDLNGKWDLGRPPEFIQGFSWNTRGCSDGYKACQAAVRVLVKKEGTQKAKLVVKELAESLWSDAQ